MSSWALEVERMAPEARRNATFGPYLVTPEGSLRLPLEMSRVSGPRQWPVEELDLLDRRVALRTPWPIAHRVDPEGLRARRACALNSTRYGLQFVPGRPVEVEEAEEVVGMAFVAGDQSQMRTSERAQFRRAR